MARPVYSVSFAAVQGLNTTHPYFLAAGETGVLRDVDLYWNPSSGLAGTFRLLGDNGQTVVFHEFLITDGEQTFQWNGRYVFTTGLLLEVTGQAIDVSASGYVLTSS